MVFRAEPTEGFLKEIKDPRISGIFSDLGIELGGDFLQSPETELAEELAVEYARLFLGPGEHISPHESVHREASSAGSGGLWGEQTVWVKRFIETAGLEYQADYTGIPDHISVELEFLEKLAQREAAAWSEENAEDAANCLKIEKMFIEEHLSKWIPTFCDKVIARAEAAFYREMAKLTRSFLEFEQNTIDDHLPRDRRSPDG
jgi:TorA maturation chaperone TorD